MVISAGNGDPSFRLPASVEDSQAEIGFALNPWFTGRGLATRAVAAGLSFGFVQLGLHRIIACMDDRNERLRQLAERVGMRREAHFRHDNFVKGEWMDSNVYAMLDDEWRRHSPELVAALAWSGSAAPEHAGGFWA
jgi:RimJ/RimL family protein N-acetyltransferase